MASQIETAKIEICNLYKEFFLYYELYYGGVAESDLQFTAESVEEAFKQCYFRIKQREKIIAVLTRAEYQE